MTTLILILMFFIFLLVIIIEGKLLHSDSKKNVIKFQCAGNYYFLLLEKLQNENFESGDLC